MKAFCDIAENLDNNPAVVTPEERLFFMAFLMPTFVKATQPGNGDARVARQTALLFSKTLKPFKDIALSLPMKPKKQKPVPAVKPAKQKKITAAHVVWWLGCENPTAENLREAAQALADIANGIYTPETLRDDIAGTCDL
jgi:hypothetical protein